MKELIEKEYNQGWIAYKCGHAFVFRAEIAKNLTNDDIEYCDHNGSKFLAAKVESLNTFCHKTEIEKLRAELEWTKAQLKKAEIALKAFISGVSSDAEICKASYYFSKKEKGK